MYRKRGELYILSNGKIYVGTRGKHIEIPGGKVEKGESPRDAAKRETLEEIGVKVKNIQKLANKPFTIKLPAGSEKSIQLTYSFRCEFDGFDKRTWGSGPEGKYHPVSIEINKLIKYFENSINSIKDEWRKQYYRNTINILKQL